MCPATVSEPRRTVFTRREKEGQAIMANSPDTTTQAASTPSIGVIMAERLYAGLIVDHEISGQLISWPETPPPTDAEGDDALVELPTDALIDQICDIVLEAVKGHEGEIGAVGLAIPGLIRNGVVEEAPNLPQLKGSHVGELLTAALASRGIGAPVTVVNDADAMAAGLASHYDT